MQLEVGFQLKQYVLEARLRYWVGRGGLACYVDGEQIVAIKFMNEKLLDSDVFDQHRQRLKLEINALLRLRKSHVPNIYDFNLDYERPYMVMQHIEGESYDHLIAKGAMLKIPLEKRFKAIALIALTLTHAHHQGIIHRDIKPANIKGFDPPYLLDFGIALEADNVEQARPDVGTGVYMPPTHEPLDKLSDIYSFALVVYEMLFEQHALFTPSTIGKTVMETRDRAGEYLRTGAWRMPSGISPDELPQDLYNVDLIQLDALFSKALGNREDRYETFALFLADLKVALASERDYPLELFDELPEESESMPILLQKLYNGDSELVQTNYPIIEDDSRISTKWLFVGITLVALLGTVISILLLLNT